MNISKHCIIFVTAMVFAHVVFAQDSVRHSTLSLRVGLNNLANKDEFQSPYTYKGTNLLVNSIYTTSTAKGQHVIDVTYSSGQMKSAVSPEANNKLFLFNYDYFMNIRRKDTHNRFVPSLGAGVHTLLSSTNYLPQVELPKHYLSAGAYLTLSGQFLYRLNEKSSLKIQGGIAVAGVVYRPDFEVNGKTLTRTTHLGKDNLFSLTLEYNYKVRPNLDITLRYKYSYFTFDAPRPVTILQNGFSIGLRKRFGRAAD